MNKDQDHISRERILTDIDKNFFVEAGAGSGKTTALVGRMVAMVESGIDISKICAITFTKAAAKEFYARFQEKLSESDSENAAKALRDIDLCFMGTIDSFCNMILSEHPAAAGIPSNAIVTENEEMDALYLREYSKILQGKEGEKLQKKAERFNGCFYNARDIFLKGMKVLSATRNARFNYMKPSCDNPDDYFSNHKTELLKILGYLLDHADEALAIESPKTARESYDSLVENYDALSGSWSDDLGSISKILGSLSGLRIIKEFDISRLGLGWERYFISHETRGKLGWYEINADADALMIDAIRRYRFSIAVDFINDCVQPIANTLRKEGRLSYNDYLLYLRDMLRQDAENEGKLIRHIYERHSYYLVDEFQDTNPVQAEIMFYLTAQQPKRDWRECRPRPGSLFIVGDPKQSIYRFRNADVSSFLRVRAMFRVPKVGEVLTLQRNFRSSAGMCTWFNDTFRKLLPEDTDIQSKFHEIPLDGKHEYSATLEGAYSYSVPFAKKISDNEDPHKVAEIIKRIIDTPEITIQAREKDAPPRRAKYSDFMLITPGKTHMTGYMRALADLGIPFKIEGKVLFNECEPLIALSHLMSAVTDPFNAKALFAAEHLSGCRLCSDDVHRYATRARHMSPAAVFTMLLEEEKVFAHAGTHNAEYVYFALELLRSAEIDGTVISIKDGSEYIARLVNDESDAERCIQLKRDSDRVHIANLHKIKGLEAPIVILADPGKRTREPDSRVDYKTIPPESYLFALDTLRTDDYASEKAKEIEVLDAEYRRLLYVAATRAESVIIISYSLTSKQEYAATNYWLPLLEQVGEDIFDRLRASHIAPVQTRQALDTEELYRHAEDTSVLRNVTSLEASYTLRRPSTITMNRITSSDDDYIDKTSEVPETVKHLSSRSREQALLTGAMVHRLMEIMVSSHDACDLDQVSTEICHDYGADKEEYGDVLRLVGNKIRKGGYPQQNDVPQDILSELLSADEVYCELPFCYNDGGGSIWHGVMDAVYRKGDVWHIVDYKTNADADDLDKQYQEQLDAYARAFKEMIGKPAIAKVYHVDV